MSFTSLGYTPGTGAQIKTDEGTSGAHMQVVKLAQSAEGNESLLQADASGLLVNVSQVQSPVQVEAPVNAPISVRLSDGTNNVDTIPVDITNSEVPITGSVSITGTPSVTGTVTANQGTPNTQANAWPVKLTDGTNSPHLSLVGSNYALDVNVVNESSGTQADKSSFTEGSGLIQVMGGVLNDSPTPPSQNEAAAVRITPYRAEHVNLRDNSGNEIGTASNPLVVLDTPPASATFWKQHKAYTASQTGVLLHDPGAGKTAYILGFAITPTAVGQVTIYDNSDSDTAELYNGQPGTNSVVPVSFGQAFPLAAVANKLYLNTGSGAAGDLNVWGYDQ